MRQRGGQGAPEMFQADWRERMGRLGRQGCRALLKEPRLDGASPVALRPRPPQAAGLSLASAVEKQDLGCGTRRPVGRVGTRAETSGD